MNNEQFNERIEYKAKTNFVSDRDLMFKAVKNNPILNKLRFVLDNKSIGIIELIDAQNNIIREIQDKYTNYNALRQKLLEDYKQKETDEIFNKLNNLEYLFNNQE